MFKNLIELTKVRIGFLNCTTTIIGFYLGAQGNIDYLLLSYLEQQLMEINLMLSLLLNNIGIVYMK